ncbi:MAG: hypothetical protein K6G89_02775 [Clostridia bacterium]|nr:hypothetical protein [Clostridia bacterium]
MKKVLALLTAVALVLSVAILPSFADPSDYNVWGNYNEGSTDLAFNIGGENGFVNMGSVISTVAPAKAVGFICPSWGNDVGSITITLWNWDTDYTTTVNSTPLYGPLEIVNYKDNSFVGFEFETPLAAGVYYVELSNGSDDPVGVWGANDHGYDGQISFFNNGNFMESLQYRMTVEYVEPLGAGENPYGKLPEGYKKYQAKGRFPLFDPNSGMTDAEGNVAGYWLIPIPIDDSVDITFNSPIWFEGFNVYIWGPNSNVFMDVLLYDAQGHQVHSGSMVYYGNSAYDFIFGESFAPGEYTLSFVFRENPEVDPSTQHFVLASGTPNLSYLGVVEVDGPFGGLNTLGAPRITLYQGDADPNYQGSGENALFGYALYDGSQAHSTGYWMHPYNVGDVLEVYFTTPYAICGFKYPYYSSPNTQIIEISLCDQNGTPFCTQTVECTGDSIGEVYFDKTYPAGEYMITFTMCENPDFDPADQHFVLASGYQRKDIDYDYIEVTGYVNAGTLGAPAIILYATESAGSQDYVLGDVDGDGEISDWDCIVIERYLAGWDVTIDESASDIDGDDDLSDWDAILLARYLAGWDIQYFD